MTIDDTITALQRTYQLVRGGRLRPNYNIDQYMDYINDQFMNFSKEVTAEDLLFIEESALTLTVPIKGQFDERKVKEEVEKRLKTLNSKDPPQNFRIGNYRFIYNPANEYLKISHRYNNDQQLIDTVLLIIKKMIAGSIIYLEEAKKNIPEDNPRACGF